MGTGWKLGIGLVVGITGVCLVIGSLTSTSRLELKTASSGTLSPIQLAPAGAGSAPQIASSHYAEAKLAMQNLGYGVNTYDMAATADSADASKPAPHPRLDAQKLVWTAQVNLEVDAPAVAGSAVQTLAAELGGYVSDMQETTHSVGSAYLSMTVRIPVAQLQPGMDKLQSLGKLLSRTLNSQDVTLQYVDTESRLKNMRNTQERLLAHLSSAVELPAIIAVEQELSRVLEQIERLQGQLNALSNQVDFATISLVLNSSPQARPIAPAEAFSSGKIFTDALRALVAFSSTLWAGAIWVAVWSPVWSVFVLAGYLLMRAKRSGV